MIIVLVLILLTNESIINNNLTNKSTHGIDFSMNNESSINGDTFELIPMDTKN